MFVGIITNAGLAQVQFAANNQGFFIYPSGFGVSSTPGILDPTRVIPNGGNWYGTPSLPGPISGRIVENVNTIKFICTIPPGQAGSITDINEIYLYTSGYAFLNYDGVQYVAVNPGTIGNGITLAFDGSSTNQTIVNAWNTANPSNQVKIVSGPSGNISPSTTLSLAGGGGATLFAIGEATNTIQYDPTGQLTLELTLGVLNSNLTGQIVFDYTQATEVADHNVDPLAHPDIQAALALASIFPTAGQNPFSFRGQPYDEQAIFQGTPSTGTYQGVTYSAVRNGPIGNSITLSFDGILTINQVVFTWNLNNPDNTVSDNAPDGTVVPVSGSVTLSGGTLLVNQWDLVYSNGGVYEQALADGSPKSNVVGFADLEFNKVNSIGFIGTTTGYPPGTLLYLSDITPGAITNNITSVQIGIQVRSSPDVILFVSRGGGGGSGFSGYDAIVTDTPGLSHYPTTQQAVNAVASGANILVDKLENVTAEITTSGKQINFYFLGPETGWIKSIGQVEIQHISFSSIPTSGTWRIYWNAQVSPDLAFNAPASDVQTVYENFGVAGILVTGNYSSGFTLTFPSNGPQPLPTFSNAGQNEIQKITFSAVPTNGCFQIEFLGNVLDVTPFFCYDNTLSQLQGFTDGVLGAGNSIWSGSFSSGFTIQYQSTLGLQPLSLLQVLNNGLVNGITPVTATPSELQGGLRPASNLKNSFNQNVVITPTEIQHGVNNGPATTIQLSANHCNFFNNGLVSGFTAGIDFNGTIGHHIELTFDDSVTQPILSYTATPEQDYSSDGSVGRVNVNLPGLRVVQHPTIAGRLVITGVGHGDLKGGILAQVLNNQILSFSGAQIDFNSGNIYASDGTTITGTFSLVSLAPNQSVWYTLSLLPGVINADNSLPGQLFVNAGTANSSLSAAFKPGFSTGSIPLAQVYQQADGLGAVAVVSQVNVTEVSPGAAATSNVVSFTQPLFQQEIPAGLVNGINTAFTLSLLPKTPTSVLVFVDNLALPSTQWTLVGQNLTLLTAPGNSQSVYVFYVTNSSSSVIAAQEVPSGKINGVNDTFSLLGSPDDQNSTMVFVDGVETEKQYWNFIQSNGITSIQFLAGSIPQPAQSVYVFYLLNLVNSNASPIVQIANDPGGVGLYDKQIGGVAYLKSLIQGPGIQIIDSGNGNITIEATGVTNVDKFQQETPIGIINGINDTFSLTQTPEDPNSLIFWVDQNPLMETDYTLIGNVITITNAGRIPSIGQAIYAYYVINQVGGGGGGGGGGAWTLENTPGTPLLITPSGLTSTSLTDLRQAWFVATSGGAVTVTATPQIAPGNSPGQEMLIKGTSNSNYPIFTPGTGLDLNGPISMTLNQNLYLFWDGTQWSEISRRA